MTIGGSCETGLQVLIGGAETATVACSANSWSYATNKTSDGVFTYNISQTDVAGNSATLSVTWSRDTVAPVLTQTLFASGSYKNTNTVTFSGSCETGVNVVISGADTNSVSCNSSSWTYVTAAKLTDGSHSYTFTQTDGAGNASSVMASWVRDTVPPALALSSPDANTSAQSSITVTGTCEKDLVINFTGSGLLSSTSSTCDAAGAFTKQLFFSSGDGTKTINISQSDSAGNTQNISRNFVRDETAPILTQTTIANPVSTNTNTVTFGGQCEMNRTVTVKKDGSLEATTTCSAGGTYSYSTAAKTVDGVSIYTFEQSDAAGNIGSVSSQWTRDTLAPSFALSTSSSVTNSANTASYSGTCEGNLLITVSGAATGTFNCSSGSWSYTTPTQTTDLSRSYTLKLTDAAGNQSTLNLTWVRDTSYPNITISGATEETTTTNSLTMSGTCDSLWSVVVSGADSTTLTCSGGTWTYASPSKSTDGSYTYSFTQTNPSNNYATTVSKTWKRDTTAPALTSSSMLVNSGTTSIDSPYAKLSFSAVDTTGRVAKFCIKVDSATQPASGDTCWVSLSTIGVTPAASVAVSNYSFQVSFDPGAHSVYLWVQDEVGNRSALTNSGAGTVNTDRVNVNYAPGQPPVVTNVLAINTDLPNNPILSGQQQVGSGQNVIVKWKATSATALAASPISIYFSTNNINWTLVANGLANSSSSGCAADNAGTTVDDGNSGCYVFSAPTAAAFAVRVQAVDTAGRASFATSVAMNTGDLKIIAGASETGLGANAKSAALMVPLYDWMDPNIKVLNSFVVTPNGWVYINDMTRGLLSINPQDGILRVFIPVTGTSSGDGGSVTAATLRKVYKVVLDFNNGLLIWDFNRIRRVDLTTNTITTLIGGGASTADTISNPLDLQIKPENGLSSDWYVEEAWRAGASTFVPMPNGDLYFQSQNWGYSYLGQKIRVYKPGDANKIQSIGFSGTGTNSERILSPSGCVLDNFAFSYNPVTSDIANTSVRLHNVWGRSSCFIDSAGNPITLTRRRRMWVSPATFTSLTSTDAKVDRDKHHPLWDYPDEWQHVNFTGRDGKLYLVRGWTGLYRYNTATEVFDLILGNGYGNCADGTDATSCKIDISDIFVNQEGKIFYVDNGRIRTIGPDGKIVTIYGSYLSDGDGGSAPTLARFAWIKSISAANDGKVLVVDGKALKAKEINASRTQITTVAGNSEMNWIAPGATAATSSISWDNGKPGLHYDPETGDIYYLTTSGGKNQLVKLNRSTGIWDYWGGASGTSYTAATAGTSTAANIYFDSGGGWRALTQFVEVRGGKAFVATQSSWSDTGSVQALSNPAILSFDLSSKVLNFVAYKWGTDLARSDNHCTDGTALTNCMLPTSVWDHKRGFFYDQANNRLLAQNPSPDGRIVSMNISTGLAGTLVNLPRASVGGFAYRASGGKQYIYYCYGTDLYKHNITDGVDAKVNLPMGMSCASRIGVTAQQDIIKYRASTDSIIFVFTQNGLSGIAEMPAP